MVRFTHRRPFSSSEVTVQGDYRDQYPPVPSCLLPGSSSFSFLLPSILPSLLPSFHRFFLASILLLACAVLLAPAWSGTVTAYLCLCFLACFLPTTACERAWEINICHSNKKGGSQ